MKLVFLGTAGYHPSETRHTSCLMLPEVGVVLDAGSGMFRVRDLLATKTLDTLAAFPVKFHIMNLALGIDELEGVNAETIHVPV